MSMEEIQSFINRQNPKLIKEIHPKLPDQNFPFALHISPNKNLKEMFPYVTSAMMMGEDRHIPRISVADTLVDCINGEDRILYNFYSKENPKAESEMKDKAHWRGGYYIYRLDYEEAIKPSVKLVPDIEYTNEYWLVNYTNNSVYIPKLIGRMIPYSSSIFISEKYPNKRFAMSLAIEAYEDFSLDKNHKIKKGHTMRVDIYDRKIIVNNKTKKDHLWEIEHLEDNKADIFQRLITKHVTLLELGE